MVHFDMADFLVWCWAITLPHHLDIPHIKKREINGAIGLINDYYI